MVKVYVGEIKTEFEFKKGSYLTAKANKNTLELYLKDKLVVTTDLSPYKEAFRLRPVLKAVILDDVEGGYKIQIVRWVDLHRHTGYSLLDGATKIEDLVAKTEYCGAITDHGVMYGFVEYFKQMKKAGKQAIIGFEAYAETKEGLKNGNHLLILAKNFKGYKNAVKLTSEAYDNFYKKPHVSYELLKKYSEGLIVTSACMGGEIAQKIFKDNYEGAKEVALIFKELWGDDFYLEIQRHNIGVEEDKINAGIIKLSKELGIKMVATTDSHYTNEEDEKEHEILLCLQTGKTISDGNRMQFRGDGYHIHTPEEIEMKFSDMPDVLDNTLEIAEKCAGFEVELGSLYMPKFDIPAPFASEDDYFRHIVWEGFEARFKGTDKLNDTVYKERVQYELDTIIKMGFPGYFLIVWDFIKYAKDNDIMVGPGRGSAVGSLVSYCIGIVDMDPIPYHLLFERFLNIERISMPDIDIDFEYERREEVISYVRQKYGEDAVSKIVTFGTLSAKAVVRDVARVMDYPYSVGDTIAKLIPNAPKMTLDKALNESEELKQLYENDADVQEIINTAKKIEGLPRQSSQHACGIIIAPSSISDYLPEVTIKNEDTGEKERTSQVVMTEVEELGLLKMDFLGLRTMGVIGNTVKSANKKLAKLGEGLIEYLTIPLTDPYVFGEIAKGKSYAVFQLESPGMRSFMVDLFSDVSPRIKAIESKYGLTGYYKVVGRSKNKEAYMKEMTAFGQELFERLIAGISLYRPGPMDYIPQYVEGMKDPEYIAYDTPELEPILKATYGTIVYQEQVMQIVQVLGGYSLGRADLVRRAMGKKKSDVMAQESEYFIRGKKDKDGNIEVPGCVGNGISEEVAEKVWSKMADFCKYAFNKSHAGGYAMIAIITAWLKHYFPYEFMSAILNSIIDNAKKLKGYLSVCKDMNIPILPPHVNQSEEQFSVDPNGKGIVFGLKGIKNMGKISEQIIKERNARGDFKSYQDFAERMAKYEKVNKKVIEALVYSGAVDCFEGTRRAKLSILDKILSSATGMKNAFLSGQITFFEFAVGEALKDIPTPEIEEFPKREKLAKEKEYAGFYVTEHPLDEYQIFFKGENIVEIKEILPDEEDDEETNSYYNGKKVRIAGIIKEIKTFYTKKDNKQLKVFTVEDRAGELGGVIFSDKIEDNRQNLFEDKIVFIDGVVKSDDRGVQIIVNQIEDIDQVKVSQQAKRVVVTLVRKDQVTTLDRIIKSNKGKVPVYLKHEGKVFKAETGFNVNAKTCSELDKAFGGGSYIIQ